MSTPNKRINLIRPSAALRCGRGARSSCAVRSALLRATQFRHWFLRLEAAVGVPSSLGSTLPASFPEPPWSSSSVHKPPSVGAPLLVASTMATLFGANEYGSAMSGLLTLPIALWEFSLGAYLVVKGFRAAGLQKLGFETDESAELASAIAPKSELRPAA